MTENDQDHPYLDAAIHAEYDIGERETSEEEARSHVLVRIFRIGLGSLVFLTGIIMLVFPGPGFLVMAAGLVVLSRDVAWADRALQYLRRKVPGIPEDGKIPRSTMVTAGALALAGILAAVWFALR